MEALRSIEKDSFHVTYNYFWLQMVTYHIMVMEKERAKEKEKEKEEGRGKGCVSFIRYILQKTPLPAAKELLVE